MKEERLEPVGVGRTQSQPKHSLVAPLVVDSSDCVVACQGVRHEEAMFEPPGVVSLPGVDYEAVA